MKASQILLSIGAMSMVVGSAPASMMSNAQARTLARPDYNPRPDYPNPRPGHPVNCSIFDNQRLDNSRRFSSTRKPGGVPKNIQGPPSTVSPPPRPPQALPPAAPPPPPPPAAAGQAVIVTGASSAQWQRSSTSRRPPYPRPWPRPIPAPQDNERYEGSEVASIKRVADVPVSTFAVDVDTASYSNIRRMLNEGGTPLSAAVRTEEMINYFRYDYPAPSSRKTPFSVTTDMAATPWNDSSRLLRIGLRGYDVHDSERPRANLVFLVDVSGSMGSKKKLPLVKSTLLKVADQLRKDDRVSIVVYSGRVGKLLTATNKKEHIKEAVNCLFASGSTAGGQALKTAYSTARSNFIKGGINRIIMATDGDFNVGTSNTDALKKMVEKERKSGVTLTMLGFGRGNIRDELMEGIANVGNGNYAYIDSAMEAQKVMGEELSSTLFTIAKDVKIQVEFNPAYVSEYRLIGYENRLLAEEDFDNDAIDAGDIGAGHQVTALYEIIPAGAKGWLPDRRYADNRKPAASSGKNGELAFVKLRYKLPQGEKSRLLSRPLSASMLSKNAKPSGDMAFATAVAAFGQKLRGDKYLGNYSYGDIAGLAGKNANGFWRQEFVQLTKLAGNNSSN